MDTLTYEQGLVLVKSLVRCKPMNGAQHWSRCRLVAAHPEYATVRPLGKRGRDEVYPWSHVKLWKARSDSAALAAAARPVADDVMKQASRAQPELVVDPEPAEPDLDDWVIAETETGRLWGGVGQPFTEDHTAAVRWPPGRSASAPAALESLHRKGATGIELVRYGELLERLTATQDDEAPPTPPLSTDDGSSGTAELVEHTDPLTPPRRVIELDGPARHDGTTTGVPVLAPADPMASLDLIAENLAMELADADRAVHEAQRKLDEAKAARQAVADRVLKVTQRLSSLLRTAGGGP